MSDTLYLLQEFLLYNDDAPKEDPPEEKITWPWNMDEYITSDEIWKIFKDTNFTPIQITARLETFEQKEFVRIFKFGISCLVKFVQCNFTGPELHKDVQNYLNEKFDVAGFIKLLAVGNEEVNVNCVHPVLLFTAKIVFEIVDVHPLVNLWWYWRSLLIHQQVLEELSPSLLTNADAIYKQFSGVSELPDKVKASLYLEFTQLYLQLRHITKSKEHIKSAKELLAVKYDFVGILGKRTKYQLNYIAQLSIKVTKEKEEVTTNTPDGATRNLPANVPLNDEVRLNTIEFKGEKDEPPVLSNLEQKLFITIIQEMLIAKPMTEVHFEELQPFLDLILNQENTYSVRVVACLQRCKMESDNRRTIERCFSQCEEIINSMKRDSPHFLYRVQDAFATGLVPVWKVEAQYGDILLDIGLVKNALDVFLKIKLWEEVIVCYNLLKMKDKAANVIKEQLEVKPTVKLWCLLGDATDDVSCYEKAWELSKRRSHRAQRHWGNYFFNKRQYEECIPHFEKSVSINPLQANVWFRLGFAASQVENWQKAATAYRRYTTLEPDGFEAWNNLAQAYIHLGNKRSAHQALLEAIRCNFDNWKVWENLMMVSCDVSHFSDVLRAYHMLLDLKPNYSNVETLNILVYNVCNDLNDGEGQPSRRFLQKTRELIGRVVLQQPQSGDVWELYASVAPATPNGMHLRAQRLQRALKGYSRKQGWEKCKKATSDVVRVCSKLSDCILDEDEGIDPKDCIVESIVLNLTSTMTAVRKMDMEGMRSQVEKVAKKMEKILEKMTANRAKPIA
ncbi:unnamed protein product [Acanthoscelides obtectus]|uniref:Tetratricopeptide repeat protein 27 n=2 Tax=Acanthoscelides obtectus TaxID=200917 RepID=A0A9P0JQT3_ACAOB|nr:unnamed protein product [Acanthoscelides obtectus]CAK1634776.1 Tetratricopeptide repeat protein 27 [Acanthoscelides obtectus]